jgi:filamentous hemagglutinin family protein
LFFTRVRPARPAAVAALVLLATGVSGPAAANPQGAIVVGGSAQIVQTSPTRLDINQTSNRAVIDWQSFSVGAGERTNFAQPSASSLAVNRVTGADPSDIAGRITANGQVVLVNPNGILIQRDSRIDAAGFVATTSGISTSDAMAGNLAFTQKSKSPTASVVNRGRITVKEGGLAALVAPAVVNDGVIRARLGKAALAAGETFTLDLFGDRLVNFAVDSQVLRRVTTTDGTPLSAAISNTGKISANGGLVEITVDVAKGVVDRAINMTGIVEARTVSQQPGAIILDGGENGAVRVAGKLDASGIGASDIGGAISVTGRRVALDGATLDASGPAGGGTIAVGGSAQGLGPLRNAARTYISASSTLRADAGTSGNGGSVTVWSDKKTRFQGAISARGGSAGGDGGAVEVSSHGVLDYQGSADLRAPFGAVGTLLLDPNDTVIQAAGTTTHPLVGTSILTTGDLQNQLLLGNVTVTTGSPASGTQPGDITVADPVTWSSGTKLTLSAFHDIAVNAKITAGNAGALTLRADNTGTGSGTIRFGAGGRISATGGAVGLFFNSLDNTNNQAVNPQSYASTQNYAGNVTLSAGASLAQYVLVNTVFDLANINNNPAGTYALGGNIDGSGLANFPMIGNFSGLFDGQGQTIDKLTINSGAANVGLFAQTSGGSTVRNVALTNLGVTATAAGGDVGGLVGRAAGAIVNATTSGSVTAPAGADAVGGLVGRTDETAAGNGSVTQSSSTATVTGGQQAGGLVGFTGGANTISLSFAGGAVSSPGNTVGGLVGHNEGAIATSYATGAVSGGSTGGLVGRDQGNATSLSQVYATGLVTGTSSATGGLVGHQSSPGTQTAAYWDTTTTKQDSAVGTGSPITAKGLKTGDFQNGVLPVGFDPSIWTAKLGAYPTLTGAGQSVAGTVFADPSGTPLAGATVRLVVNGIDTGLTATSDASGGYSFALPGGTIPAAGGEVLAVVTAGGAGNAFFDGASGSLGALDIYAGNFLTVYSSAGSLSTAASGLHVASGGAAPPATVAASLLFSPTTTSSLSINPGGGLWLRPSAAAFSLDLPFGNSGATVLLSSTGSVSETAQSSITAAAGRLLLLGGGNYTLSGAATPNNIATLAANTGSLTFADGALGTNVDLATGTIFGVAGVTASGALNLRTSGNLTLAAGAPVAGSGAGTAVTLVAGGAFTNNAGGDAIRVGGGGRFLVYSQNPASDNRGGLAYSFKQYNATLATAVQGTGNGFLYAVAPTLTLTGVAKTYDGTTAFPSGSAGYSGTGTIDGDTVALAPSAGSYDTKSAGTGKTVTLAGVATQDAVDPTGAAIFGYTLAPLAANNTIGTIARAPLTLSAVADTKTYDGTTASSAMPTVSGLVAGDLVTGLSQIFDSRNAGARTLSVGSGFSVTDGFGGANYAVTTKTAAGAITPAALTITPTNGSKIYDGTTAAAAVPTVSGLIPGDTVTSLAEIFPSKNVGTYQLSVAPGFSVNDGNNGANYTVKVLTFADFQIIGVRSFLSSIFPAPLTIAAVADSETYTGTTASLATPTVTGLVTSDLVTGLGQIFDSRNAGARTLSINPGFTISDGNGGANYTVTTKTAAGTITPAPLTVTATANTKIFDATTSAAALPAITAGALAAGDGATLSESYSDPAVGTGKLLIPAASISDGNGGNNYALTLVALPLGVITGAQPTLTAAIEQGTNAAAQQQAAATAAEPVLIPGRTDLVSRIVQGFDLKLNSPRQALFIVLPNEDGSVGAITIDDGKTRTTLDKPYAAAELRAGEAVAAEVDPEDAEDLFGRKRQRRR